MSDSFFPQHFFDRPKKTRPDVSESPLRIVNEEAQPLGSSIGNLDIRCTLEGISSKWRPKWCTSDTQMEGILYFDLEFDLSGKAAMRYATVRIEVGHPPNDEPVPIVTDRAPNEAIEGEPMRRSITKTLKIAPKIAITAVGVSVAAEGGEYVVADAADLTRHWTLTSGDPSINKKRKDTSAKIMRTNVEFKWQPGFKDDHDGRNRHFLTAVAVKHKRHPATSTAAKSSVDPGERQFRITVEVDAMPYSRWHKIVHTRPKAQTSNWLQPNSDLKPAEYQTACSVLQDEVWEGNLKRRPSSSKEPTENQGLTAPQPHLPAAIGQGFYLVPWTVPPSGLPSNMTSAESPSILTT